VQKPLMIVNNMVISTEEKMSYLCCKFFDVLLEAILNDRPKPSKNKTTKAMK